MFKIGHLTEKLMFGSKIFYNNVQTLDKNKEKEKPEKKEKESSYYCLEQIFDKVTKKYMIKKCGNQRMVSTTITQ